MVAFDQKRLAELCVRHDVQVLRLFGSAARGEDGPDSDIDLIVDFDSPKSFFDLGSLEEDLTVFLGRTVDLQTERSISRHFRDLVIASARVIYDRTGCGRVPEAHARCH